MNPKDITKTFLSSTTEYEFAETLLANEIPIDTIDLLWEVLQAYNSEIGLDEELPF